MAGSDLVGLIGVIVGGVIGVAGSFVPHWWERRRAQKSAQALARAYLSGILRMEEVRRHSLLYEQCLAGLLSGTSQAVMQIFGAEDAGDPIQQALIGQIGLLKPDIATDVVAFINMLDGLRVDLKAMATGQMDAIPVTEKIRIVESDRQLWIDTLGLGRGLLGRLGQAARPKPPASADAATPALPQSVFRQR
jgi:hypothetical protein